MQIPSMAFYALQLSFDNPARHSGTGIEIESLINFLSAQSSQLAARVVNYPPKGAYPTRQRQQLVDLVAPNEDILLFLYPKVPFLGYKGFSRDLPFAILGYLRLALKKKRTQQKWVVLITDLPVEQRRLTKPINSPGEVRDKLAECANLCQLSAAELFLTLFERFLFKRADWIVSLSPLMTTHLLLKHGLPQEKILLRGRNLYLPSYSGLPPPLTVEPSAGARVFYSGDLRQPNTIASLKNIILVFNNFPSAHFYLCGAGGEWIDRTLQNGRGDNIHYLGVLENTAHDAIARQCQVGIIAYNHGYAHLVPTTKYSAYIANGLAVLSTDLITLSQVLQEDGTGMAVSIEDMPPQLLHWLQNPELVRPYNTQARSLAPRFIEGECMQTWLKQIL
jgi:hypothetical protein